MLTALGLVAVMGAALLGGRPAFFALIVLVVSIALFEALDALVQKGGRPGVALGVAAGAALLVAAYRDRFDLVGPILMATALLALVRALRPERGATPAGDAAGTILTVAWVGGGGAAATGILMLPPGAPLVVAFVLVAAIHDIAAYFVGTAVGRHKMAPSISAGKSWEGAAAGALAAVAAGLALGYVFDEVGPGHGLAVGSIAAVVVPIGDLAESLFKREAGIKDSGRLLPGHGGLLDRLDAIVFTAPAVYLYLEWFVF